MGIWNAHVRHSGIRNPWNIKGIRESSITQVHHLLISSPQWLVTSQKCYFPLILSVKLCLLLGYHRVFKIDRATTWGIWIGLAACTIFYVIIFFVDLFRCKPIEASWNPTIEGTCMSYAAFPYATGIFNIISDFYILLLPLPVIFKMTMTWTRRLRIASIFGLGALWVLEDIAVITNA